MQQQIDEDEDNSEEERERILDTDKGQVDYDRPAGIEHLRRDCPKVPIDIKGTTFLRLINSGAELNTIKKETVERAMLLITSLLRGISLARIVSANSMTKRFLGIIWGVPITIGGIEVRTNFFVMESCTNPIILGNPYLTNSRAKINYATNSLTYYKIFSKDRSYYTQFVCARGNQITTPANIKLGKGQGM